MLTWTAAKVPVAPAQTAVEETVSAHAEHAAAAAAADASVAAAADTVAIPQINSGGGRRRFRCLHACTLTP